LFDSAVRFEGENPYTGKLDLGVGVPQDMSGGIRLWLTFVKGQD
jgi:hypothetical protein